MSWQQPPPGDSYGSGGGYPSYEPVAPGPAGDEPGAYGAGAPRVDGVSIAAFVCALTCCAAPIGLGLGIAGLVRTKNGRRGGRWAAITGTVLGALVTLAGAALLAFSIVLAAQTLWEEDARVGQCLDVNFIDEEVKASCADPHDGEVIWVGEFDRDLVDRYTAVEDDHEFCASLPDLDPQYVDALESGRYEAEISISDFDVDDPATGSLFFCYLERANGAQVEGRIGQLGA
ncbi:hypothetical protein L615_005200000250 [Nocardioides sp. J9]|uniref:DUF4190 domain-containing protein n=1 Tax=Nocardioides sp. J9 TaxID=935844 RepID=UPI0011AC5593|nr:DUF4190 domain-containing protein [Nocardioides sp. J9]TWG94865.1 hypothetical protein L615_005200000250 [Nocardioides sp. J9]